MARTRNLKPGFFKNVKLVKLGPLSQLLFAGLWTIADREGRLEDEPERIKVEVLPYQRCHVDSLLNGLAEAGFITRYGIGDSRYIAIPTWKKHQNPHVKEQPSTIPAPDIPVQEQDEHGKFRHEPGLLLSSLTLNPSPNHLNPEYGAAVADNGNIPPELVQSEYPKTLAAIRAIDPAVDETFVRTLANRVAHTILSHPTFPQKDATRAMKDAVLAKACRESFATGPPDHRAGLLLNRVPNIIVTWGLENEAK